MAPGPARLHATRLAAECSLKLFGGLTTSGDENIKNIEGPYAQAANHHSLFDIAVTGVAAYRADRQQLHYLAKDNLDKPGLGPWLAGGGTMYLDRNIGLTSDNHEDISARAKADAAFIVWPEGHRYRGPLRRENLTRLVIVPLIFEHNLTVVPVGIAGTEPGDFGFFHIAYEKSFKPEPVDFETKPDWDHRRRTAMLSKAIRTQLGKDAVGCFMEDLYQGMSAAESEATDRRQERMDRRKISRTILLPLSKGSGRMFREKRFGLKKTA
jgi:1-acyl-sn-glycerol-3-phosphate acyltransferase